MQPLDVITYPVNVNGAADHTIITGVTGKRWVVYACYVVAGGAATIEVKSATTAVTGELDLSNTVPLDFSEATGIPLWVGRATGNALVFTTVGAVDFDGWVLAGLIDAVN